MVMLLVGYPLSAGPAIWLAERDFMPELAWDGVVVFYSPLDLVDECGPQPIRDALEWHVEFRND